MTDPTIASGHLELIAALITRALDLLESVSSPCANECEIQAGTALHAIRSVERDIGTDLATMAVEIGAGAVESAEPGALLAAAERELIDLPPQVRNQIAVCAAAAHLRRARRALVTP